MFTSPLLKSSFINRKSFKFDGINDFINWNNLLNDISTDTTGAISIWAKVPPDDNTQRTFFSISNNASATLTELSFIMDFREATGAFPGNSFNFLAIGDSANKWTANAGADFLIPHIGNWINIIITHDALTPILFVNGASIPLTFELSADKTFWFKGALTDAAAKSDVGTIGALRRNGSIITPYNENLDEVAPYNGTLNLAEAIEIYNLGKGGDLEKLSSASKLVSWLTMGDNPADNATSGTGIIIDKKRLNNAIPFNTAGDNIESDVA